MVAQDYLFMCHDALAVALPCLMRVLSPVARVKDEYH